MLQGSTDPRRCKGGSAGGADADGTFGRVTPYGRGLTLCLALGACGGLLAAVVIGPVDRESVAGESASTVGPLAAASTVPPVAAVAAPAMSGLTTSTSATAAISIGSTTSTSVLAPTSTTSTTSTTSSTTSSTSTTTTTVDPNAPRTVRLLFTGDIIPENPVLAAGRRAADGSGARFEFRPLFAPVAALVGSFDLAVCHMEVPVGAPGEQPGVRGRSPFGGNRLVGPFELAGALGATGFDRCSTASNHAFDIGAGGIDSTIDALESVGMSWSGTAQRPEELPASIVEVRSVRIAHLSYTRSSNTARPADPWRLAFADDPAVVAQDVSVARAAGVDLVVISIHLSKELRAGTTPTIGRSWRPSSPQRMSTR